MTKPYVQNSRVRSAPLWLWLQMTGVSTYLEREVARCGFVQERYKMREKERIHGSDDIKTKAAVSGRGQEGQSPRSGCGRHRVGDPVTQGWSGWGRRGGRGWGQQHGVVHGVVRHRQGQSCFE